MPYYLTPRRLPLPLCLVLTPLVPFSIQADPAVTFSEPMQQVKNAWDKDDLFGFEVDMNYTTVFIDPIEKHIDDTSSGGVSVADIQTDDIYTVTFGVKVFPKSYDINLSYTQSIGISGSETSSDIAADEDVEELGINFRPSENTQFLYSRYRLNSYMNVNQGETVLLIDHSNTTARDTSVSATDQGVDVLTGGDTSTLRVARDHFEFRYYSTESELLGARRFAGLFYEEFTKPWSSGFEVWHETADINNKVAAVYSQSTMKVVGLSFGYEKDNSELLPGFNLKQLSMNIGLLDIGLTDNYSLSSRMED